MTNIIVFWAQSLDNKSPDHIMLRGDNLSSEKIEERRKAVSIVSKVMETRSKPFEKDGVRLTNNGSRFVLEVPSIELDNIGRISPIVCCGEIGNETSAVNVWEELSKFAQGIQRSIDGNQLFVLRMAFDQLKKKAITRKIVQLTIAGLLLAGVACCWSLKKNTPTQETQERQHLNSRIIK